MENHKANPNIIQSDKTISVTTENGTKYQHKRKNLTEHLTDNKIVASIYEVEPGKISWPYHFHFANEEAFYILEGEGEIRLNDEWFSITKGDYIRFTKGPEGAHQIKNTGKTKLKYLDIGTTNEPDITIYPDTNKVGLFAGSAPGQSKQNRKLGKFIDIDSDIDYWEGE